LRNHEISLIYELGLAIARKNRYVRTCQALMESPETAGSMGLGSNVV